MGKCQCSQYLINNPCTQLNVNMETTEWNICHNLVSNLMACPDKAHLQQKEIFGSPPPRSSTHPQWQEEDSKNIKMNLLLEDSKVNNDNQNSYQMTSTKENAEDPSIHSISNRLSDIHLNPIIVCEAIEESSSDRVSGLSRDNNELKLSVPSVDISDEKKRPPITES